MAGQLVHYEIPAEDPVRAREFWGGVIGWRFDQAFDGIDYHLTQIAERMGGAVTSTEPGRNGPRAYFDVDDLDAGAARVKELGGEASERMPVPGMGWFVVCSDPQGNEFGLWQDDRSAPTPER